MQNTTTVVISKNKDISEDCVAYNSLYQWPIDEYNTILRNIDDALFGRHEVNIELTMVRNKLYATYTWKDDFKE